MHNVHIIPTKYQLYFIMYLFCEFIYVAHKNKGSHSLTHVDLLMWNSVGINIISELVAAVGAPAVRVGEVDEDVVDVMQLAISITVKQCPKLVELY